MSSIQFYSIEFFPKSKQPDPKQLDLHTNIHRRYHKKQTVWGLQNAELPPSHYRFNISHSKNDIDSLPCVWNGLYPHKIYRWRSEGVRGEWQTLSNHTNCDKSLNEEKDFITNTPNSIAGSGVTGMQSTFLRTEWIYKWDLMVKSELIRKVRKEHLRRWENHMGGKTPKMWTIWEIKEHQVWLEQNEPAGDCLKIGKETGIQWLGFVIQGL